MQERTPERTDEALMLAYQLGEISAFDELYRRYSSKVYGYLLSRVRERALADDVFQGVFLKLHSSRSLYDSGLPFAPWLFSVCRSVLIDRLRRTERMRELEAVLAQDPALQCESTASESAGREVNLSGLDPRSRKAVELRYLEEKSFQEIARTLETSEANARQLLSRAVRFLRKKGAQT